MYDFLLKMYSVLPMGIKRIIMKCIHFMLCLRGLYIDINLVDHCNLNCKGCDNYSPIAQQNFIEKEKLFHDLERLDKLLGRQLKCVRFMGGEPLLHPDICEILLNSRSILTEKELLIISNGTLLPKMDARFWEICRDCKIEIMLTKYPIKFDYDSAIDKINSYGIKCGAFNKEALKTLFRKPLDVNGAQDKALQFDLCLNANRCVALRDGKLFTCTTIPTVEHLNKYFDLKFDVCKEDYLDIYENHTAHQVRHFLNRPIPFCRYCKNHGEQFGIEWSTSNKEVSEWVDFD